MKPDTFYHKPDVLAFNMLIHKKRVPRAYWVCGIDEAGRAAPTEVGASLAQLLQDYAFR